MSQYERMNQAMELFSDWSMPWAYFQKTVEFSVLDAQKRAQLNEIWEQANRAAHWVEPSLKEGPELVRIALQEQYPWLSEGSIINLIRGASYNWK